MTQHSELSASSASRWMTCPGSVRLSRGIQREESSYAQEGSAAHEVARRCLIEEHDADQYFGQEIAGFTVDQAMAAAVQIYVDVCRRLIDACDVPYIEQRVDLAGIGPPVPMFGTSDFVAYSKRRRELNLVDFKYGRGIWVPASNNEQLHYYALGASLLIDDPVSKISMTIVQPRFSKAAPIRTATVDAIELAEWSIELLARAHATQRHDAPTVAGDHCKFCPAKGSCLTHQTWRSNAAYHEFSLADVNVTGA